MFADDEDALIDLLCGDAAALNMFMDADLPAESVYKAICCLNTHLQEPCDRAGRYDFIQMLWYVKYCELLLHVIYLEEREFYECVHLCD